MTTERQQSEDIRHYSPLNQLEYKGRGGGLYCYLIPAPIGLRSDSYASVRLFLEALVLHFTFRLGCEHESFIQMRRTGNREASYLFADHAGGWIPEMGLGVWPHRPAPRLWKIDDFENMDRDTGMPTILHSLYRVTAEGNARLNAMTTMAGTGCGLQLVTGTKSAEVLRGLTELFLGFIQDRVFRIFPWYVPLLDKTAIIEPLDPLTIRAMQNVSLYIRESPEDAGILIVSAEPLTEIISQLGCEEVEHGLVPRWKLSE